MTERPEPVRSSIVNSTTYLIVTGVLVAVLGQWAITLIWPKEEPTEDLNSLIQQSPISLARWQDMTLKLLHASEDIRKPLFDDYRGEQVVWIGYFDQFTNLAADRASANHAVTVIMYDSRRSLDSDQLLGPPFVRCFFSEDQLAAISELQRGQRIVVRGTLANPTLMGTALATDLNKCQLLAADDATEQLAILPGVSLR